MAASLQRIVQSNWFSTVVFLAIVLTSALVGVETYAAFDPGTTAGQTVLLIQQVILWFFALEIVLKMAARWPRPHTYFTDGWNILDFLVVAVCFLPFGTQYAAVVRLARTLRVLRLVTVLPKLQVLVAALLKSIPSLGYVGALLFVHFYIYAVIGVFLFGQNDPMHFRNLHTSLLTLFEIVTLEGWIDIMNIQVHGSDVVGYADVPPYIASLPRVSAEFPTVAPIYFVSFILLGTMIVLNLFTGTIIAGMEEARDEAIRERLEKAKAARGGTTEAQDLSAISDQIARLSESVAMLQKRLENGVRSSP